MTLLAVVFLMESHESRKARLSNYDKQMETFYYTSAQNNSFQKKNVHKWYILAPSIVLTHQSWHKMAASL